MRNNFKTRKIILLKYKSNQCKYFDMSLNPGHRDRCQQTQHPVPNSSIYLRRNCTKSVERRKEFCVNMFRNTQILLRNGLGYYFRRDTFRNAHSDVSFEFCQYSATQTQTETVYFSEPPDWRITILTPSCQYKLIFNN